MLAIVGALVASIYYRGMLGGIGLIGAYLVVGILIRILDSMSMMAYQCSNRTTTVLLWPLRMRFMISDSLRRKRSTDRFQICMDGLQMRSEPLTFQKQSEALARAHQLADASGESVLVQDSGTFAKSGLLDSWSYRHFFIEPQSN